VLLVVTGGAGFIGSNFIRYWLDRYPSDPIVHVDLLTYAGDPATLGDVQQRHGSRYSFVRGDIADASAMREVLGSVRPDAIVNFAAESHNSRAVVDPVRFTRTNVLGTHVLVEAARAAGVPRFHHISTCEVYGDLPLDGGVAFTEASPFRPRTPYNASKASADLIVRAAFDTFGFPATISNCSNNYGAWQHPEKVIPLFTTNALEDRPLPLYRRSEHRREWLHVDDHCRAIDAVLRHGRIGETYNVGSGEERSIEQLADSILRGLGKPASLKTYVADRPVYQLGLVPETPNSLVTEVTIGVDAATGLPLRVQVNTRSGTVAIDSKFTSIRFKRPAESNFAFRPPPEATVTDGATVSREPDYSDDWQKERDRERALEDVQSVTGVDDTLLRLATTGDGWEEVVAITGLDWWRLDNLGRTAKTITGPYGTGQVLETPVFSLLILPSGRIVAGAVTPEGLEPAATQIASLR